MGGDSSKADFFSASNAKSNFALGRVIGRGAFGKVYAITNKDTGTLFAMKLLNKEELLERKMVRRTMDERDILLALQEGPYIVHLLYAFQTPKDLCVVLDLMSGGSLQYHLSKHGKFDWRRATFYTAQVLLALEYLKKIRILHRDLKPDNLLLDAAGNCHVTDFNVSAIIPEGQDQVQGVAGSLSYMAPEVFDREKYSYGVDVWGAACVYYAMGRGRPPFSKGESQDERRAAIRSMETTYEEVPDDIAALFQKAFVPQDQRITLEEMMQDPCFKAHKVKWSKLRDKTHKTPFTPSTKANVDGRFDLEEQFLMKKKQKQLGEAQQALFQGWDYDPDNGLGVGVSAGEVYKAQLENLKALPTVDPRLLKKSRSTSAAKHEDSADANIKKSRSAGK